MFPSRPHQRIGRAILELAEAMLAPMPPDEDELVETDMEHIGADDHNPLFAADDAGEPRLAPHPHHAGRRIRHPRRHRAGAVATSPQTCTTPLVRRSARTDAPTRAV